LQHIYSSSITMTDNLLNYIVIWVVGILAVFSFGMGVEKMIKITLWNYILSSLCLAAGESITLLINFFNKTPESTIIGISYEGFANFFSSWKTTLILLLYAWLLIVVYLKWKIQIRIPEEDGLQKLLYIILVPLTVTSIIITLQIALMWLQVLDVTKLQGLSETITWDNYFYKFFSITPVRIFLHWLATILITSELKVNFRSDK